MTPRYRIGSGPQSAMPVFRNGRFGNRPVPPGNANQALELPNRSDREVNTGLSEEHAPRYCVATVQTSETRRNLRSYARRSGIRLSPVLIELQTHRRASVYALRRTAENCGSLPIRSDTGGGSWHK